MESRESKLKEFQHLDCVEEVNVVKTCFIVTNVMIDGLMVTSNIKQSFSFEMKFRSLDKYDKKTLKELF